MKIDEPKTPYNYAEPDENSADQLDAELLAEKWVIFAFNLNLQHERNQYEYGRALKWKWHWFEIRLCPFNKKHEFLLHSTFHRLSAVARAPSTDSDENEEPETEEQKRKNTLHSNPKPIANHFHSSSTIHFFSRETYWIWKTP